MEVAAPSCPPGRLPACECLAQSHSWALCGEAVCLAPPASVSTMNASTASCMCGLGNFLILLESPGLKAGALASAWPGFKSHIMLQTGWDFTSLSLSLFKYAY